MYPCKIKIELTDIDKVKTVVSKGFNSYTKAGELENIAEVFNDLMNVANFTFFDKDTIFPYFLNENEHKALLLKLTEIRKTKEPIKDANLIETSDCGSNEYISINMYYKTPDNEIEYSTSDIVEYNSVQTIFKLLYNFIYLTDLQSEYKNTNKILLTESISYSERQSLLKYLKELRE